MANTPPSSAQARQSRGERCISSPFSTVIKQSESSGVILQDYQAAAFVHLLKTIVTRPEVPLVEEDAQSPHSLNFRCSE